jgi:predicted permease
MDVLWQDLRFGYRQLVKRPVLTLVAVVSLGLGIGANTTVFNFVNALLLRPLPVEEPERLAEIYTSEAQGDQYGTVAYPDYAYYRDHSEVFSGVAAHGMMLLSMTTQGKGEVVWGEMVSGNYFTVLGVRPALGSLSLPADDRDVASSSVAVISHNIWRRRFASDPNIVGKTVTLDGHGFTVMGVADEKFTGTMAGLVPEVWVPIGMQALVKPGDDLVNSRKARTLFVIGRLKPGVSLEQAGANVAVLASQLEQSFPETNKGRGATLAAASSILPQARGAVAAFLGLLMAVVALVLLIACTNVANLLLARATGRRKEIAMRLALGASRWRLVRQLLTESALLSLLGGAVGLFIAIWATKLLLAFKPPLPVQITLDLGLDTRVLGFTLGLSFLTGMIAGVLPAFQATRPNLVPALKDDAQGAGGGPRRFRLSNLLVVAQVTLSLVLVIGGGLFLRSLQRSQVVDPGFKNRDLLVATLMLELHGYSEPAGRVFFKQLEQRVAALPGVQSVSLASHIPLGLENRMTGIAVSGYDAPANGDAMQVGYNIVGPKYFETLGIQLLQGRDFNDSDDPKKPRVVIVNETMAQRFWPGQDPIGRTLRMADETGPKGPEMQVIGVVKNGKYRSLSETPQPFMHMPFQQNYEPLMSLLVRGPGAPQNMIVPVQREVQAIDPNLPFFEVKTLDEHLSIALLPQRIAAVLLGVFSLFALLLTSVGLYGVVSYTVRRRTREIGIRIALGAQRSHIIRLVVRQGMLLAFIGILIGLAAAFGLTRFVSGMLYEVGATDAVTFGGSALLLTLVTLAASLIPARKATRVDPMTSLRAE